ncbi:MAG TPA: ABATE domain-containing protein [Ktedonobacteraceae bacterium]|nr:ABATE domain-containing protein [Ktedonobacteraceae bacterium]
MEEYERQEQIFDLTGGLLCLDFANTVDDRTETHPQELLVNFEDLVSWSRQAQVLTEQEAQRLLEKATQHPSEATRVLQRAVEVREAIFRIFKAVAEDETPEEGDLVILSTMVAEAQKHARIVPGTNGFRWDWVDKPDELDCMIWPIVRSAADYLISDDLDTVRVCASDSCNWLFIDTSKNHSRRWCNMKSCGNREKARRFYTRKKSSSAVS